MDFAFSKEQKLTLIKQRIRATKFGKKLRESSFCQELSRRRMDRI